MKKFALLLVLLFNFLMGSAQESGAVEMADAMRASGKIYVVVTVLLLLFIGIVIYLIRLDKKITKLENESKK